MHVRLRWCLSAQKYTVHLPDLGNPDSAAVETLISATLHFESFKDLGTFMMLESETSCSVFNPPISWRKSRFVRLNDNNCDHVLTLTHHLNRIEDVSVAVDHDAHRDKETGQEEQEDEGGIVGVLGRPVQRAAQPVDLQGVAVPAQKRSSCPGQRVEPDVADGPPRPGEIDHLSVDHADVALVGQGSQGHDGNDAWWKWGGREQDLGQ